MSDPIEHVLWLLHSVSPGHAGVALRKEVSLRVEGALGQGGGRGQEDFGARLVVYLYRMSFASVLLSLRFWRDVMHAVY